MATDGYLHLDLAMEGLIRMLHGFYLDIFCLDSNPVGCEMFLSVPILCDGLCMDFLFFYKPWKFMFQNLVLFLMRNLNHCTVVQRKCIFHKEEHILYFFLHM